MSIEARHVQTDRLNTFVREAGDPASPVLLLVHGNVSSSAFFEELMEDLAADFRVIAPDQRGYSPGARPPRVRDHTMDRLVGDVVAVNPDLDASPQAVNEDPYGAGWMARIQLSDPSELEQLLRADGYAAHVGA